MTNIPFGNSDFQIINFIANEHTPERAVRAICLQLDKKQIALKEHELRKREREIRKKEIEHYINSGVDEFEKERLELELEKNNYYAKREEKLLDDCLHEIETYKKLLSKFPNYTREQFEQAELGYWQKRFCNDAKNELLQSGRVEKGTLESLEKIGLTLKRDKDKLLIVNKNSMLSEY